MRARHVVILGGGITGLVAAYRLSQSRETTAGPIQCTIIEQDSRFGGKIHTERSDDYTLELGPDSIYTRKSGGTELIEELGLEDDIVAVSPGTQTLVWHDGRLQPLPAGFSIGVPSDLRGLVETPLLSLDGKRRALEDLLLPYEPLGNDVSLGQFLRSRLGDELVDIIASPLLAGIHAGDIDRMSLEATMPVLKKLHLEHRSLLLGAMTLVRQAPPSTTVSTPTKPVFINLRLGLQQLIETLVARLTGLVQLELNTRAVAIQKTQSGKYLIRVMHNGVERPLEADAVIATTPAFVTADLVAHLPLNTNSLRALRYASTATVSFGYKRSPLPPDFSSSGFLIPRDEGTIITACTVVSNKWSHAARTGNTLIRCYVGRDGAEEALAWDDGMLVAEVAKDLRKSLGVDATADFVEVKRWPKSMPQYDVNHLNRVQEIEDDLASSPGLALAGAAYRGMGIPDCIHDATRAAKLIEQYLGTLE